MNACDNLQTFRCKTEEKQTLKDFIEVSVCKAEMIQRVLTEERNCTIHIWITLPILSNYVRL